ncbi:DUF6207 family protein [Streptomyces sp. NPDC056086]
MTNRHPRRPRSPGEPGVRLRCYLDLRQELDPLPGPGARLPQRS